MELLTRRAMRVLADAVIESTEDVRLRALFVALNAKSRKYSFLAKASFWTALPATVAVAAWPAIALAWFSPAQFALSAAIQTAATGIAAGAAVGYRHYKVRQMMADVALVRLAGPDSTAVEAFELTEALLFQIDRGIVLGAARHPSPDEITSALREKIDRRSSPPADA